MSTRTIAVQLPEPIFEQLDRLAKLTHQPLEAIVAQSIASNLPPAVDTAPIELQSELLSLQTLSVEQLLDIANGEISASQQKRHLDLLEKNETETISPEERQELRQLRQTSDRLMLKKAHAWAILRWRGYPVPALERRYARHGFNSYRSGNDYSIAVE